MKASERKQMQTWRAPELRAFLDSVADDPLFPLFLTLATTGMRRGEALGLRWRDLDFDAGRAAIRQAVVCVGHETRFSEPKTDRSKRSVPLPSETITALRSHRAAQAQRRLASENYQDLDLVFAGSDGRPLDPESLSAKVRPQGPFGGGAENPSP